MSRQCVCVLEFVWVSECVYVSACMCVWVLKTARIDEWEYELREDAKLISKQTK